MTFRTVGHYVLSKKGLDVACVSGALAAAGFLGVALLVGSQLLLFYMLALAGGSAGFSAGILLIRRGDASREDSGGISMKEVGTVAGCGALLALFSYWCGMRQFGGNDQSVLIDVGWRLINGQRPYVDFPCTLPVGFYLGAELAFRLFGVYWRSQVLLNSIWSFLCLIWLYLIVRGVFEDRRLAFWSALCCVTISTITDAFWWYNPVTNLTTVIYAASVVAVMLAPAEFSRWASLCVSLYLAALMKPNVCGPLILGGSIGLFVFRRTRLRAALASLLALLLWFLTIHIHGSTLLQVCTGYLAVASRGFSLNQFMGGLHWPEKVTGLALLLAVLGPCVARFRRGYPRPDTAIMLFTGFCAFSGLYGFLTNCDLPIVEFPLIFLTSCLVVASRLRSPSCLRLPELWGKYLTFLCVWLTCIGLTNGALRTRVRDIGDFFEFKISPKPFAVPFFTGLSTGPIFHSVLNHMAAMKAAGDLKNAYFYDRLQFGYAAFDIPSPRNQPIWWFAGVSFRAADERTYEDDWFSRNFNPVFIMDPTFLDDRFRSGIISRYGLLSELSFDSGSPAPLHTLKLRTDGAATLPPWRPYK